MNAQIPLPEPLQVATSEASLVQPPAVLQLPDMAHLGRGACADASMSNGQETDGPASVSVTTNPDPSRHTGYSLESRDQGTGASACLTPCNPVIPQPPWVRDWCIQEWEDYVCTYTCAVVCTGCVELAAESVGDVA